MRGLLALQWAARRAGQVDAVVTWCAPLFADRADAAHRAGTRRALRRLRRGGVPVVHAVAARDVLAPPDAVAALGTDARALTVLTYPAGDHLLPLADPQWCLQVLVDVLRNGAGG
jgi:pimeloyl-ACP methyl ester carboxylesterase